MSEEQIGGPAVREAPEAGPPAGVGRCSDTLGWLPYWNTAAGLSRLSEPSNSMAAS